MASTTTTTIYTSIICVYTICRSQQARTDSTTANRKTGSGICGTLGRALAHPCTQAGPLKTRGRAWPMSCRYRPARQGTAQVPVWLCLICAAYPKAGAGVSPLAEDPDSQWAHSSPASGRLNPELGRASPSTSGHSHAILRSALSPRGCQSLPASPGGSTGSPGIPVSRFSP